MRTKSENVVIPGAIGMLEGIIDSCEESSHPNSKSYVAICCHPHPQHAGTMTNKVIHTASRAIAGLGIDSIRFNFRGVGKSEGSYGEGVGEQDDLATVVDWTSQRYPSRKLLLIGFSFGAYISAMQAKTLKPELLISIAPPIGRIEFTQFETPDCPWLIIQGEQDELVEAQLVYRWASELKGVPQISKMPETSHFFHGKLVQLRSEVESFCAKVLSLN